MATSAEIRTAIDQVKGRMAEIDAEIADLEKAEEPQSEYLLRLSKEVGKKNPAKGVEIADLAYRARYAESQNVRATNKEGREMLKGVAAEFGQIKPTDQASWTAARNRWVVQYPNLANIIPEVASQAAWDQLQAGYGRATEVAPTSEYGKRKEAVDWAKTFGTLAAGAATSSPTASAEFAEAGKAALQGVGVMSGSGAGINTKLAAYEKDLAAIDNATTADAIPEAQIQALLTKMEADGLKGPELTAAKNTIMDRAKRTQEGKGGARTYGDAQQKAFADAYNTAIAPRAALRSKIMNVINLAKSGMDMGALGTSAKEIQQDVLADTEFLRYMPKDFSSQVLNIVKGRAGFAPDVDKASLAAVINTLISGYNQAVSALDIDSKKVDTNKYVLEKLDLSPLPIITATDIATNKGGAGGTPTLIAKPLSKDDAKAEAKLRDLYGLERSGKYWVATNAKGDILKIAEVK